MQARVPGTLVFSYYTCDHDIILLLNFALLLHKSLEVFPLSLAFEQP